MPAIINIAHGDYRAIIGNIMPAINFNVPSDMCLFCESENLAHFRADAYDREFGEVSVVECRECRFAWQYPFGRSEEESVDFFQSAYADKGESESQYFTTNAKRAIAEIEYTFMDGLPRETQTLLDVGAGAGIFARVAAENGWEVLAVDPALDESAIQDVTAVSRLRGTIDDVPAETTFDVVTLWDVIEHVSDPAAMVRAAKSHIKKGGWLVIETGNYTSAGRIESGTNHWIYQLDHRWYFGPDSISKLLRDAGFSQLTFCNRLLRPGWSGSIGYAGPDWRNSAKSILRRPGRLRSEVRKYLQLKEASKWQMAGVEIFAVAARV